MNIRRAHVPNSNKLAHASGDYSDSQLLRVNRQAIVLHKFYELLIDAITRLHWHQKLPKLSVVMQLWSLRLGFGMPTT